MNNKVYRLKNQIKHYKWGSSHILPEFLGVDNDSGMPFAEMWMGTHRNAPSQVQIDGSFTGLKEAAGEIPFLFKLLAIEKPLSIQAHPDKKQAEEGFNKENGSGVSLDAPIRNYKDTNHKPEIICAVSAVELMAGFREPENIIESLKEFSSLSAPVKEIAAPLIDSLKTGALFDFYRTLINFSRMEQEYVRALIRDKTDGQGTAAITESQWKMMKEFVNLYPGDSSVLAPLYLNCITLTPGQAVFIPAGVLHAYISGFAVELMISSDNVLRGGLTLKHIDIEELMKILEFTPYYPKIISIPYDDPGLRRWFCFDTPCGEFLLAFMKESGEIAFPGRKPAVCVVMEGDLRVDGMSFKKGESFFIPDGGSGADEPVLFKGDFSLYAACSGSQ